METGMEDWGWIKQREICLMVGSGDILVPIFEIAT